jgi:hypothetical protein
MVTTTGSDRSRITVERSASGEVLLRCEHVLVMRTSRGTWSIEIQVGAAGVQRRLQVPIGRHKVLNRLATEIGDLTPIPEASENGPMR